MSQYDFGETLDPTRKANRDDIYFTGGALSRRIHDGRYIDIEVEGGLGYQFADIPGNNSGQVWGAVYFRYDVFPWNRYVFTTVAINTGLNYSFRKTAYEVAEDFDDGTRKLLHYLAPEITLAHPDNREWELVLRLHHRSGVFGLLGCDSCGSNMVTAGVRRRF